MAKIRAVIFDMDGVLIEAKDWHYEALNKALGLFGMQISRYDHLVTFDGLPTKKKLEMLSMERNLPQGLHNFINQMKQLYTMQIVYTSCKPTFIHEYALSKLKSAGYKLAVCSNSIQATIETMMQKSALLQYLDFYLSNQDVKKPKPDPEIYNKAIGRLQLKPDEVMIIEDNDHGIKAAKATGANVMIVQSVLDVNLDNIQSHIDRFERNAND
ncbi:MULTISPECIES: HAD family hydrolase [Helicobacter]|uniref:HAD hydrolase, family IA n=3 Tax=Helicobacter bilis TaxID=37372 RepID=C3XEP0_9HELI|nr:MULTISPECIES: HAD family phosphatase [Helicobacter]EEO23479.1 HAD hydrolase, family IA [Helicobacter bilis ATCC 43879]EMZ40741.1 HAD hydrolase, family IA [Helicobacter bilis WiWa]MDY5950146.1 HAD family phosphatase [Helicobacter sp.]TLE03613.1 HAD family phosphatase [Helicobacter bilis]TLE04382.1 HAD family phosphatase [Helicobacter bilis]